MQIQFNLAEILHLAREGLARMREDDPESPRMLWIEPQLVDIANALAFTGPKCLADYTVTLDMLDVFET